MKNHITLKLIILVNFIVSSINAQFWKNLNSATMIGEFKVLLTRGIGHKKNTICI